MKEDFDYNQSFSMNSFSKVKSTEGGRKITISNKQEYLLEKVIECVVEIIEEKQLITPTVAFYIKERFKQIAIRRLTSRAIELNCVFPSNLLQIVNNISIITLTDMLNVAIKTEDDQKLANKYKHIYWDIHQSLQLSDSRQVKWIQFVLQIFFKCIFYGEAMMRQKIPTYIEEIDSIAQKIRLKLCQNNDTLFKLKQHYQDLLKQVSFPNYIIKHQILALNLPSNLQNCLKLYQSLMKMIYSWIEDLNKQDQFIYQINFTLILNQKKMQMLDRLDKINSMQQQLFQLFKNSLLNNGNHSNNYQLVSRLYSQNFAIKNYIQNYIQKQYFFNVDIMFSQIKKLKQVSYLLFQFLNVYKTPSQQQIELQSQSCSSYTKGQLIQDVQTSQKERLGDPYDTAQTDQDKTEMQNSEEELLKKKQKIQRKTNKKGKRWEQKVAGRQVIKSLEAQPILSQIIKDPPINRQGLSKRRTILVHYKNGPIKAITQESKHSPWAITQESNHSRWAITSGEDIDEDSVCSSIYLDFDADLNTEYSFIGVLITIKNSDQSVSASTASLINSRTIITCIHAFQNDKQDFTTSEIIFIPNCMDSLKSFRYSAQISKEDVWSTNNDPRFNYQAVGRELAMFSLSEPIRLGIKAPICASYEEMTSKRVFIVGYPLSEISYSFHKHSIVNEEQAYIKRQYYEGDYMKIIPSSNIIEHNLPTQAGVSGAPIMFRSETNPKEIMIVGIHTHGAKKKGSYNMGLVFNKEMVEMIKRFKAENEEKTQSNEGDQSSIDSEETNSKITSYVSTK